MIKRIIITITKRTTSRNCIDGRTSRKINVNLLLLSERHACGIILIRTVIITIGFYVAEFYFFLYRKTYKTSLICFNYDFTRPVRAMIKMCSFQKRYCTIVDKTRARFSSNVFGAIIKMKRTGVRVLRPQ